MRTDAFHGWFSRSEVEALGSSLARRVEVYEEIDSTQRRAREIARETSRGTSRSPAQSGTVVIARAQNGGAGRLGRSWGSPPGGLWMSLILRPTLEARFAPRITQTASVAVAKALRTLGVAAEIKWPNDLLVRGRKICGVLAESSVAISGGLEYAVLGIGLNANLDVRDLGVPEDRATTLRRELGRDVELLKVLREILSSLETELGGLEDFASVLEDWKSLDCTLGRKVRIRRSGGVLEGEAVDLASDGALILRTENGATHEVFEGEIETLRPIP